MPRDAAPDVVLLAVGWQPRALVRAELIERGYAVVATDDWISTRRHLRPGSKPHLVIVDLKDLPNPQEVLDSLRVLMAPHRVLVLLAGGTMSKRDIERLGFVLLPRPFVLGDLVNTAARVIASKDPEHE
jgi:hypothetical protein